MAHKNILDALLS